MSLPAHLLERLPNEVRRGHLGLEKDEPVLPLGIADLDAVLPGGGLPRGGVVELSVSGGVAFATSVALAAFRSAKKGAELNGGEAPWCAFLDPSVTLHGPGVASAGVDLERLLVVRPSIEALGRTAIRVVESQAFAVVAVDTVGIPGAQLSVSLTSWLRIVRRLSVAAESSNAVVLLITDGEARRSLPLPVALRLELGRPAVEKLSVRVAKERRGRVSGPRTIVWSKPRAKALVPRPLVAVASS
jgi:recombination protein RecA